jgi:hypothetical protein
LAATATAEEVIPIRLKLQNITAGLSVKGKHFLTNLDVITVFKLRNKPRSEELVTPAVKMDRSAGIQPDWGDYEAFIFGWDGVSMLEISVYDRDVTGSDDLIGAVAVDLFRLKDGLRSGRTVKAELKYNGFQTKNFLKFDICLEGSASTTKKVSLTDKKKLKSVKSLYTNTTIPSTQDLRAANKQYRDREGVPAAMRK